MAELSSKHQQSRHWFRSQHRCLWAQTGRSLRSAPMIAKRSIRPFAGAACAGAAIARTRGTCVVAAQRVSSMRSFTGVVLAGTKTVLSLHAIQANETPDLFAIRAFRGKPESKIPCHAPHSRGLCDSRCVRYSPKRINVWVCCGGICLLRLWHYIR